MKHVYILIIISLVGLKGVSQSLAFSTVGQVYNFEIGDTFEYSNTARNFVGIQGCNMNGHSMQVILNKWLSSDTLYYQIQSSSSFTIYFSSSPSGSASSGIDTNTIWYTNLDSLVFYGEQITYCGSPYLCHYDSAFFDSSYCAVKTNRHFEGIHNWAYQSNDFADGLGIVQTLSFSEDNQLEQGSSTMIYSSKANGQVCGTFRPFTIATDIPDANADDIEISVFPNPCTTTIHLKISPPTYSQTYFQLYDGLGRQVKKEEINSGSIDIHRDNLPNGIYFWQLQSNNRVLKRGKLIMQ